MKVKWAIQKEAVQANNYELGLEANLPGSESRLIIYLPCDLREVT